jgi:hypothetical protein
MKTKLKSLLFLLFLIILSACVPVIGDDVSYPPTPVSVTTEASSSLLPIDREYKFVSNNDIQYLSTPIDLVSATQIEIPLHQQPIWLAGIPHTDGVAWVVSFEDGSLRAFIVDPNGYKEVGISPGKISTGMPLTIYSSNGKLFALTGPTTDVAPHSQPIFIDGASTNIAYIANNGDLVILEDDVETRLPVNALLDSRILIDEDGRLLILTHPTDRYAHGVLGDSFEAAGITLIATKPEPKILTSISILEPDVIEGIFPIWTDMNKDGEKEIIVTLSNTQDGARIVAFHEDGNMLAEGAAIGKGNRWRHQLIVAPFGNFDESLLAVVRTPHIGGVLEFYKLYGEILEITETISGFSTHSIGSRNLFTTQAGDFDNDGKVDLLIPDQSHTRLGIVNMENESTTWIDLHSELITNLAAVDIPGNNRVAIAAGLSNNSLIIWFD